MHILNLSRLKIFSSSGSCDVKIIISITALNDGFYIKIESSYILKFSGSFHRKLRSLQYVCLAISEALRDTSKGKHTKN